MTKGFFEDSKGERSMMRLLSFIITVSAVLWGTTEIIWNLFKPFDIHETLILSTFGLGLGLKAIQKHTEK
jgi:hypothetical protein